jgi:hypothetical protein
MFNPLFMLRVLDFGGAPQHLVSLIMFGLILQPKKEG